MIRLLDRGMEQLTTILLKMGDVAEKTVSTASARFTLLGFPHQKPHVSIVPALPWFTVNPVEK